MSLQISSGLDRTIAIFEDGWASGAMNDGDVPPSYVEASLREFWLDGYHTGVADRREAALSMPMRAADTGGFSRDPDATTPQYLIPGPPRQHCSKGDRIEH